MPGLHNSSFCVEHDDASAMYANIALAVFVFYFFDATGTLWLGGLELIESVQPVRVDLFKNHVAITSLSQSLAIFCHNPSYVSASRCA